MEICYAESEVFTIVCRAGDPQAPFFLAGQKKPKFSCTTGIFETSIWSLSFALIFHSNERFFGVERFGQNIRNTKMENDEPVRVDRKRNKIFRFCKRCFKWTLLAVLAYIAILLIGLIPVNNDFVPAENGVTIYVISNAVHADIIVPCENEVFNWNEPFGTTDFVGDVTGESHVAIGWGDRGFFLETQTWDDFKLSTAVNALLVPSECCLHVSYTRPDYYLNPTAVTLSLIHI